MSKFNLSTYEKISGDEHIEMRLRTQHEEEKDVISEEQLDDHRVEEEDNLIEELLRRRREKSSVKEASETIEKMLDNDKAKFNIKLRNSDAYNGDMNKVEEQRLKNDPIEDEVYEASSEYPKKLRWWEEGKESPDGLKLASDSPKRLRRIAQSEELDFSTYRGDEFSDWGGGADESGMSDISFEDDFDVVDEGDISESPMIIVNEKVLPPPVAGLYMQLEYQPGTMESEEAKVTAYDKVIEEKPELTGLIDRDNFSVKEDGVIVLRAVGPEFEALSSDAGASTDILFDEVSFEEQEIDGTPMAMGSIKVNTPITDVNRDAVVAEALDFISENHPGLNISSDALDLSRLQSAGEIGYIVSGDKLAPAKLEPEMSPEMQDIDFSIQDEDEVAAIASSGQEIKTAIKKK